MFLEQLFVLKLKISFEKFVMRKHFFLLGFVWPFYNHLLLHSELISISIKFFELQVHRRIQLSLLLRIFIIAFLLLFTLNFLNNQLVLLLSWQTHLLIFNGVRINTVKIKKVFVFSYKSSHSTSVEVSPYLRRPYELLRLVYVFWVSSCKGRRATLPVVLMD